MAKTPKTSTPADPDETVETFTVDPDTDLAATVETTDPDAAEPDPEPEAFDAIASSHGRLVDTPVLEAPLLYGFEEEAPKDSSILLDEPDPSEAPEPVQGVGEFVAFGVEHVSRGDGEWVVDPETGCITGPA